MKFLFLTGSQRRNGNTARILNLIEGHLREIGSASAHSIEIDKVALGDEAISPCRGCRICFNRGEDLCPVGDDLHHIRTKMMAADALIVATPVYVNDVSGITKNWIDRFAYLCHRPGLAGKHAYLLATVGNGPSRHALTTLDYALRSWGATVAGKKGFKMGGLMANDEIDRRYGDDCTAIAHQLFSSVIQRRDQYPSFLSLMTFRIQQCYWQREDEDSVDRAYWYNKGWTDADVTYYVPHRTHPLIVASARMIGTGLAPFVT